MIDFRPILFVIGLLLVTLAAAMLLPALADLIVGNPDWQVFVTSAAVTLFIGVALVLTNRAEVMSLSLRQAFALTTLSWIVIAGFGALPLSFSELKLSYTDAYFEAMSGITTTGSTVIVGLDTAPPGILLWRSLLQWMGGIGFIAVAVLVMPMLQVGGMQLFRMESSDKSDKAMPRAVQVIGGIALIYLALTLACAAALRLAGMSGFDAINHAMAALGTGGFSTYDASVAAFANPSAEWVLVVFMLVGGTTFTFFLRLARGDWSQFRLDTQMHTYLGIFAAFTLALTAWLAARGMPAHEALRAAAFNVSSILTTTGFASTDYTLWGTFPVAAFYFLTFIGACSGSTAGGLKVFRLQVLYAICHRQLLLLIHPHRTHVAHYNNRPITDALALSVLSFTFLYGVTFGTVALALSLFGLDLVTALSSAATALANVGPGLGEIVGPAGNFSSLPAGAKWLMALAMMLGRLELFTFFVMLTRAFWRR